MTNETQPSSPSGTWKPRIVAFFCNWCTYTAADLAGVSRMKHASNVRIIRLMCSGRVDPQFIVDALARGADGVLIGGCHPNDCHYVEGNYKCLRRWQMLKRMVADMGIEPERLRLESMVRFDPTALLGVSTSMTVHLMGAVVALLAVVALVVGLAATRRSVSPIDVRISQRLDRHPVG